MSSRLSVTALVVLAALAAGTGSAQQPGEGPRVTMYRTFIDPEYTVVQGLVGIDPAQLDTTCEYGMNVVVRDGSNTELVNQTWENRCPQLEGRHAQALETFQFGLRPAGYTVEVSVFPKGQPAARRTTRLQVEAFNPPPLASDLILAHDVAVVDSATAGQWTIRRGNIGVRAASETAIDPAQPDLAYYLELYPRKGEPLNGSATGIVRRADGKELASFPLQQIAAVSVAQPLAARLSVAGLPPGAYTFDVRLQLADTVVVRSNRFEILAPAPGVASGAAIPPYFAALTEAQLTELFDPVVVWLANASEADKYRSLSPTGKRAYLARYFGNQVPTPDDDNESAIDAFLQRVQTANTRFAERAGRGAQSGWQTDRGRIYMLRGEPPGRTARPSPVRGAPYELWYYTTQNRYYYVFADETGLGNYRLTFTNDPQQEGVSHREGRLGPELLEDMRQLGIQIPYSDRSGGTRP